MHLRDTRPRECRRQLAVSGMRHFADAGPDACLVENSLCQRIGRNFSCIKEAGDAGQQRKHRRILQEI